MKLKDRYAIAGVGCTPQGRIPERTALNFYTESCANASMDAGLARKDHDKAFSLPKFKPLRG